MSIFREPVTRDRARDSGMALCPLCFLAGLDSVRATG